MKFSLFLESDPLQSLKSIIFIPNTEQNVAKLLKLWSDPCDIYQVKTKSPMTQRGLKFALEDVH